MNAKVPAWRDTRARVTYAYVYMYVYTYINIHMNVKVPEWRKRPFVTIIIYGHDSLRTYISREPAVP